MTEPPLDLALEFGRCWDADTCTMDPKCMNFDNCEVTEQEMVEEANQ